ncbi:MAG TPA: hypothetical protein VIG99_11020 [Myxococcaceae bacterium]|jgi:hypothetical protein
MRPTPLHLALAALAFSAAVACSLQPLEPVPPDPDAGLPDGGAPDGGAADGGTSDGGCPSASQMPAVQAFFNRKCAGCHPSDFSPDLGNGRSRNALVNRFPVGVCGPPSSSANPSWRLVVPGDLENSMLWRYVQGCACGSACLSAMSPPCNSGARCGSKDPICTGKSDAPSAADRAAVQCWILQGAPP